MQKKKAIKSYIGFSKRANRTTRLFFGSSNFEAMDEHNLSQGVKTLGNDSSETELGKLSMVANRISSNLLCQDAPKPQTISFSQPWNISNSFRKSFKRKDKRTIPSSIPENFKTIESFSQSRNTIDSRKDTHNSFLKTSKVFSQQKFGIEDMKKGCQNLIKAIAYQNKINLNKCSKKPNKLKNLDEKMKTVVLKRIKKEKMERIKSKHSRAKSTESKKNLQDNLSRNAIELEQARIKYIYEGILCKAGKEDARKLFKRYFSQSHRGVKVTDIEKEIDGRKQYDMVEKLKKFNCEVLDFRKKNEVGARIKLKEKEQVFTAKDRHDRTKKYGRWYIPPSRYACKLSNLTDYEQSHL